MSSISGVISSLFINFCFACSSFNFFLYYPHNYLSSYSFSEPATPLMMGIIDLHHTIFFYLIVVFILVFWLLLYLMLFNVNYNGVSNFNHCSYLEIAWTMLPSFIIGAILVPSLSLLHSSDEFVDPEITLKVIGHQWYWSYEYSDYNSLDPLNEIGFDSYIKSNWINLLSDPILVLPVRTVIRFLITSEDVLHSWAIPAWGVKMDAVPGRLNQVIISLFKEGLYYGQCSEICGIGHGFMPITIEVLPTVYYLQWLYFKNPSSLPDNTLPYSSSGIHELVNISYFSSSKDFLDFFNEEFFFTSFKDLVYLNELNLLSEEFSNLDSALCSDLLTDSDVLLTFLKNSYVYERLYKTNNVDEFLEDQIMSLFVQVCETKSERRRIGGLLDYLMFIHETVEVFFPVSD